MELESSLLQHQISSGYRNLQPQVAHTLQHGQPHLGHPSLVDLTGLDDNDVGFQQDLQRMQASPHSQSIYHNSTAFSQNNDHRHLHQQNLGSPHTPHQLGGNQFPLLAPAPRGHRSVTRLQEVDDIFSSDQQSVFSTKVVPDPPSLEEWRQRLFSVDEMITLSEDEFQTYFPHVDNVYSHRSTQKYKRKPFVSHYWDCRLKGRPPGTPKSDDPNKKKRKRTARERDLCDVKIKITEYFPGAMLRPDFVPDGGQDSSSFYPPDQTSSLQQQSFHVLAPDQHVPSDHPGINGARYYTIQRVNGNGGNGKGDGVAGPHKHSLADSDKVKKNSIQRFLLKKDKEEKKSQKVYHKKATGLALATVRKHAKEHDLKLFGNCSCPFAQRVWITLEAKGIQYQYIEVDPYKKPASLIEVNPRGQVPGIRHGNWGCGESTVLMEYLEDLGIGPSLLPVGNPQLKATCRLWSDHISRNIIPTFYTYLQAQELERQADNAKKLQEQISLLVEACPDPEGPFFLGPQLSFVDIQFAPWMLQTTRVLKPYRGWSDTDLGARWARWLEAVEDNEHVKATTSGNDLYKDSYERYAQNRANASQLADEINEGLGMP